VAPVERKSDQPSTGNNQSLRLGERVTVSTLNAEGVVTALGESDAEVQIGSLRVRARLIDLVRKGQDAESPVASNQSPASSRQSSVVSTKSPGLELNLRGKLVDEGLDEL